MRLDCFLIKTFGGDQDFVNDAGVELVAGSGATCLVATDAEGDVRCACVDVVGLIGLYGLVEDADRLIECLCQRAGRLEPLILGQRFTQRGR